MTEVLDPRLTEPPTKDRDGGLRRIRSTARRTAVLPNR
jgi:hypothetical protein